VPTTFTTGSAPGKLPLVGHMWPLMRRPIDFLGSSSSRGDLVEIRLGRVPAYVPCHPELVRQVLTDDRTFDKGGPLYDRARPIVGNGLGSCPHHEHRRQRRLVQPAFHRARLKQYSAVMEGEIASLLASWQDGQVIDAYPVFYDLALRTSIRTLFAGYAGELDVSDFRDSFDTVLHHIVTQMFLPQGLQRLPTPANRRYRRALDHLNRSVAKIIADYRRSGADHGDLMSILIASPEADEGAGLDDSEVHDQIMSLLLAASETVPACLSWALYLLSLHPESSLRLHDEVARVLGGRAACWEDLENLPYTTRVITETLRLYPPGWLFTRVTTRATELAGTHLPAGTTVIFSPPAVHRRDDTYPDPQEFDPDRWLPERMPHLPRGAFTSFGGGARKCIGDSFAMTELTLALATIVQQWQADCTGDTDARAASLSVVYHPRRLLLRLTRRIPQPDRAAALASARSAMPADSVPQPVGQSPRRRPGGHL
jgi:pentalenene oxygenase